VHLVDFIIEIYHDARYHERQIWFYCHSNTAGVITLKLKNNYYFVVRFWTDFYDFSQLTASFSVNFSIITRPFGRDITLSLR
jgi:hypothetical protein